MMLTLKYLFRLTVISLLEVPPPFPRIGFEPIDREILDVAPFWTMVSKTGFSANGEVRSFEIFSGAANRGLRVGIYRPTGTTCHFTLVQQNEWSGFKKGYNKVL